MATKLETMFGSDTGVDIWVKSPSVDKIAQSFDENFAELRSAAAKTKKGKRELRKWLSALSKLCSTARKELLEQMG